MPVAKKIQSSIEKSSWIRKMFEEGMVRKAKYGAENVFDFSIGNPNLEPPAKFKEVLRDLAADTKAGVHGYMPNAGHVETRKAVADYLSKHNRQGFGPDDIVMTVGAGGGLNVVFKTILNPGEEVIIPSPYFVEYNSYLGSALAMVLSTLRVRRAGKGHFRPRKLTVFSAITAGVISGRLSFG